MSLWEPAGWEHGGGKSAELSVWVQAGGGAAGALSAYRTLHVFKA